MNRDDLEKLSKDELVGKRRLGPSGIVAVGMWKIG
jgi:hypothetical protein